MNKKGFTLIELLAVIVILAIIALIATPIVLNMIESARKSAAKSAAYGYIEAIEYNNGFAELSTDAGISGYTKITTGDVSTINTALGSHIKGKKPDSGSVTVGTDGKVTGAEFCINGYTVTYAAPEITNVDKGCSGSSTPEPDPEPEYTWNSYVTIEGETNSLSEYGTDIYIRKDTTKNYSEVCLKFSNKTECITNSTTGRQSEFGGANVVTGYTNQKKEEILSLWSGSTCEVTQDYGLTCYIPISNDYYDYYIMIYPSGYVSVMKGTLQETQRKCSISNSGYTECIGMY